VFAGLGPAIKGDPLTAGLLQPFPPDNKLQQQRLSQLDKLYQRVVQALDNLVHAVGLKAA
jgi:hypothetical protein